MVVKEWGSLLVGRNYVLLASEADFLAEDTWDCNYKSGDEEETHDNECEDPLECNRLGEELANSESGCKNAEGEADGVILL